MRPRINRVPLDQLCHVTGARRAGNALVFTSEHGYSAQANIDSAGRFEVDLVPSVRAGYYTVNAGEATARRQGQLRVWVPNTPKANFDSIISRTS